MLDQLLKALSREESLSVTLSRDAKGRGKLILSSAVEFDPDEKDEAQRQLRAAIAQPLVVRLDKDESADTVLKEAVESYAENQRESRDALADFRSTHASNRARAETAKPKSKDEKKKSSSPKGGSESSASPDSGTKDADDANAAPAPTSADENPPSLF